MTAAFELAASNKECYHRVDNELLDYPINQLPNRPIRLAWFSPLPPVRSGIATNSAELVAALEREFAIDVFVDQALGNPRALPAHDFVWRNHKQPYDLTVYQLGNSSHHNYEWPYLFRHPGLVVLHDTHLHHARAASLLREKRAGDYRAEFRAGEPNVNADVAELGVAGFDSHLYYMWPMTRLVIEASRVTAVHSRGSAVDLRQDFPTATIEMIQLSQGMPVDDERQGRARRTMRERYGIAADAMLFGVFGGLAPDKRVPQILDALSATASAVPSAHLLLAGAPAAHFDVVSEIRRRALSARVTMTGYVDTDDDLTDCIAACDVSLNLRWPTAGEVSGPWLRALAAGKPTITIDLAHMWHVPSLDPRTWTVNGGPGNRGAGGPAEAVTVAVDILDEDHSLRLAMRRLATDAALRASLGAAARDYWMREHSLERSLEDYRRVIAMALDRKSAARPSLPPHLLNEGDRRLHDLLRPLGLEVSF